MADIAVDELIQIQICYARPNAVTSIPISVSRSTAIANVLKLSKIDAVHPEIDLVTCRFGVFGKLKRPEDILHAGDRLEIYRPLIADPKDARRRRVHKERVANGTETGKF
jgi:uncharacterized protein